MIIKQLETKNIELTLSLHIEEKPDAIIVHLHHYNKQTGVCYGYDYPAEEYTKALADYEKIMKSDGKIKWDDLTPSEQEQAENSYISLMKDVAVDGDEEDIKFYQLIKNNRTERIENLKCKSFIRDVDGYIFVNL